MNTYTYRQSRPIFSVEDQRSTSLKTNNKILLELNNQPIIPIHILNDVPTFGKQHDPAVLRTGSVQMLANVASLETAPSADSGFVQSLSTLNVHSVHLAVVLVCFV